MVLKLYNTRTRKKEALKPLNGEEVRMYCCGPTVYDFAHIGNLRTYIFEDILKRVLLYDGFKVKHVTNITDVGHLTSDAEEGEDKLIKALRREHLPLNKESMLKLAHKYTIEFKKNLKQLNILEPDIWCKATEHIPQMIDLIKRIEKNGYAYKTSVGVIYDTSKFKNYAKFAKLTLEQLKQGARVEADPERKNPTDFALWITNQPKHIMQWDSPWGKGFPGWHIECSAMSMEYLGDNFDIHCGGIDHIPVHHTNEIAQAEAATGKEWVHYWLHGEFLVVSREKMAKSAGTFVILQTVIDNKFNPMDYRYYTLNAHYRKQLNFDWSSLENAKNSYNRLKKNILEFKEHETSKNPNKKDTYHNEFVKAINDDLNMPLALSATWDVVRSTEIGSKEKLELLFDFDKVLGLKLAEIEGENKELPPEILDMVNERDEARRQRDFKRADMLRDKLKAKGIVLEDKDGKTVWRSENE